jgi:hypothetical protein
MPRATVTLESAGPDLVRTPFTVLVDKAEKAPWTFSGIRARSFIDKEMRTYIVRTERRYLGIGQGDYSIDGFAGCVGIERKSVDDFRGTLLGWPYEDEETGGTVDRRGRFKTELRKLAAMECKAVVVEGTLDECLDSCPGWGTRTGPENAKYLLATYLSWSQQFRVPWYFCQDKQDAAVLAFRLMEHFWDRTGRRELQKRAKAQLELIA